MSSLVWWQTIASGAAGGGITLAGQWLGGRQDSDARVRALQEERLLARVERRDEFELGVLLELRRSLGELVDEAYDIREASDEAHREIGDGSVVWEDGGGKDYGTAYAEARRGLVGVLDDPVRQRILSFLDLVTAFTGSRRDETWDTFRRGVEDVYDALGERIRALYGPDEEAKYRRGITGPKRSAK